MGYYLSKSKIIQVSEDEVICQWLKGEVYNVNSEFYPYYQNKIKDIGDYIELINPNFEDKNENENRRHVFAVRGDYDLWKPICASTKWYKTTLWLNNPFTNRKILSPFPKNINNKNNMNLNNIILWGHSFDKELIILEGNHRWSSKKKWYLHYTNVYIGISDTNYFLYNETVCKKCN